MLDVDADGTSRVSRLGSDERVVHADLHNHTRISDGKGEPERAFASLRAAGLDVAALTDHAVLASMLGKLVALPLNPLTGIDQRSWQQLRELADAADEDGAFVALRGFEWSSPVRGHVNVWGTDDYTDPLHDFGWGLGRLYDWLTSPDGRQGLASFNHPGGRFDSFVLGGFALRPAARDQLVALEVFNTREDYVFRVSGRGRRSPLCRCLDAGWRPGLTGVTDEHGTDWGRPLGKGRTGLWVAGLTRALVRDALRARRAYATRERGLRLDATLAGVRMGSAVTTTGPARLRLDLGTAAPADLQVQLLGTGPRLPTQLLTAPLTVPGDVLEIDVPAEVIAGAQGSWLVLRVADLRAGDEPGAPAGWGRSVAYASPWWLDRST